MAAPPAMDAAAPNDAALDVEEPTLEPEPPAFRSLPEPDAPTLEPEPPPFPRVPPAVDAPAGGAGPDSLSAAVAPPSSIAAAVGAAPVVPPSASAAMPAVEPQSGRPSSKIERRLAQLAPAVAAGTAAEPAIGVVDAELFDCPACGRPLMRGTSRCTNCGTRLVAGRPLRRVATFAAIGIVAILVLAGVAMTVSAMSSSNPSTGNVPHGSPAASHPAATASTPTEAPVTRPGIPAGAEAALTGTAVVNARITSDAAALARTLSDAKAPTIDVARAMRVVAADAQLGLDLTGRLAPWTEAAPVMTKLDAFYNGLADSARNALRVSLTDSTGYRRAGGQLLTLVRGLAAVDAASRELATGAGISLPPLTAPAAASPSPSS